MSSFKRTETGRIGFESPDIDVKPPKSGDTDADAADFGSRMDRTRNPYPQHVENHPKTFLQGLLSAISIQSVAVSVVTVLLGYASVRGTVLEEEALPLVAVFALGHFCFYGMNDYVDYEWDRLQSRTNKPLVSQKIDKGSLAVTIILWFSASLLIALATFNILSFILYVLASVAGARYNLTSKEFAHAYAYLAAWAVLTVFAGAYYIGDPNALTGVLALAVAVHMIWMTFMGNLKDIQNGENSIPDRLDCRVIVREGRRQLFTSVRFNMVSAAVVMLEIIFIGLIPLADGLTLSDVPFIYASFLGALVIWRTFVSVIIQNPFDRSKMKRDIVNHEAASIVSLLIVSLSFISPLSVAAMIALSVLWGMGWQTILYGDPLEFP